MYSLSVRSARILKHIRNALIKKEAYQVIDRETNELIKDNLNLHGGIFYFKFGQKKNSYVLAYHLSSTSTSQNSSILFSIKWLFSIIAMPRGPEYTESRFKQ